MDSGGEEEERRGRYMRWIVGIGRRRGGGKFYLERGEGWGYGGGPW